MCVLLASFVCAACATPEDPARAALRERLKQEASLTPEDLSRLRAEVSATIEDKAVLVRDNEGTHDLGGRRSEVFGMLTNPTGMFDEGLRTHDGSAYRILNAPAHSMTMEIEAVQRLWIDVDTFEPRRFEYAHAYPNPSDYTLELIVDR